MYGPQSSYVNPSVGTLVAYSPVLNDVIVGADGACSQVREALAAQVNFPCAHILIPDPYKSVLLTQPEAGGRLVADKVHTWNLQGARPGSAHGKVCAISPSTDQPCYPRV